MDEIPRSTTLNDFFMGYSVHSHDVAHIKPNLLILIHNHSKIYYFLHKRSQQKYGCKTLSITELSQTCWILRATNGNSSAASMLSEWKGAHGTATKWGLPYHSVYPPTLPLQYLSIMRMTLDNLRFSQLTDTRVRRWQN